MKELMEAARKMNAILHKCEEEGDNMDVTLNKLNTVIVHCVTFPTLMLLEIIDKFAEGYKERQKKIDIPATEDDIRKMYEKASANWNSKLN